MMTNDLPSRPLASSWAPLRRSAFFASSTARWVSNFTLLASVARSALPRRSRKLRAKPSFTLTTWPKLPSLATRSRRMISIFQFSLLQDVGKQAQEAGALDGLGELALLLGGDRRDAAWHDLATLGNIALQKAHILVIVL